MIMRKLILNFLHTARDIRLGWLLLASMSILLFVLGLWEILEERYFGTLSEGAFESLLLTRGILLGTLLIGWSLWTVYHFRLQHHHQSALTESLYRNIVENSADAIITIGLDNHVESWNRGAERLFGWTAREILGHPIGRIIPDDLIEAGELLCLAYGVRQDGQVKNYQTERLAKGGRKIQVNLTETSLSNGGEVIGRSQIIRDISEMQQIEQQMRQSDRLATVGQLAAGVAHEIGNPLTSISSLVQLLERRLAETEHHSKLARIRSNIERITKIVRELVDFTRPQMTDMRFIKVNEVIRSAVGLMSYDNRSQKVKIELELEDLPGIKAAPDKLHQVIVNLLANAFDALREQGDTVTITSRNQAGHVIVEVRDNGPGMDAKVQDKIFEPFYTTKEIGKGTGLGLSVSHGIIKSMNGEIHVESRPGGGAVFSIILPREP